MNHLLPRVSGLTAGFRSAQGSPGEMGSREKV